MRDLGLDALVKASRTVNAPSQDARERHRRRLAARIAAGMAVGAAASAAREGAAALAGASAPGTGAGASAAVSGGFAKWAIVSSILIVVGGATGVGLYVARSRASTTPNFAVSTEAVAPKSLPAEPLAPGAGTEPHLGLPTRSDAPETPSPATPSGQALASTAPVGEQRARREASARSGGSTIDARSFERELQLLRSARRVLDTGSPAQALALLDRYAAEFPRGALRPEFQTTRILALCAAGRVASAQQARDQFIKQQPGSPLSEGLRATCADRR